jgi:hypothetical protein
MRGLKKGAKTGRFGRQKALFPKLFSLLQIRFFGDKRGFTGCLQGFFGVGRGVFGHAFCTHGGQALFKRCV